jgi:hypothetical protein
VSLLICLSRSRLLGLDERLLLLELLAFELFVKKLVLLHRHRNDQRQLRLGCLAVKLSIISLMHISNVLGLILRVRVSLNKFLHAIQLC